MKDHWQDFRNRWHLVEAPLRPNQDVVDAIRAAVGSRDGRVLLLGVTPELAAAFDHLIAIDKSDGMIGALWRPHAATQHVREGNWLDLDESAGEFSAIVGDCSLNALQSAEEMDNVARIVSERLADDGVFACRLFERPKRPYTDADLAAAMEAGTHGNFHAFKWQIALNIAELSGPAVRAVDILAKFDALFPDRDAVAAKTGWARNVIDTIDVYRDSDTLLMFPNRDEYDALFSRHFGRHGWISCGTYDLAERCPIVVAQHR